MGTRAMRFAEVIRFFLFFFSFSSPSTSGILNAGVVDRRWSLLGLASWDRERNRRGRHRRAAVASSVKLPIVVGRAWLGEGLRRGWSSRLVQGVRALVLLTHPVHDKHDHQYRAEEAHYRAANHSCKHHRNLHIANIRYHPLLALAKNNLYRIKTRGVVATAETVRTERRRLLTREIFIERRVEFGEKKILSPHLPASTPGCAKNELARSSCFGFII